MLLLKVAVPMLATASAKAQDKTLVEICTVYGVTTIALDADGDSPAPEHTVTHSGDHCVLSAVMALAAPQPAETPALLAEHRLQAVLVSVAATTAPDASARWRAQLKQGPPALA